MLQYKCKHEVKEQKIFCCYKVNNIRRKIITDKGQYLQHWVKHRWEPLKTCQVGSSAGLQLFHLEQNHQAFMHHSSTRILDSNFGEKCLINKHQTKETKLFTFMRDK